MQSDFESLFAKIADLAKARVEKVPEKRVRSLPKTKKPVKLCEHGKRKWPNKTMPHCGPCWTVYMRAAKRRSLESLKKAGMV